MENKKQKNHGTTTFSLDVQDFLSGPIGPFQIVHKLLLAYPDDRTVNIACP